MWLIAQRKEMNKIKWKYEIKIHRTAPALFAKVDKTRMCSKVTEPKHSSVTHSNTSLVGGLSHRRQVEGSDCLTFKLFQVNGLKQITAREVKALSDTTSHSGHPAAGW